MNDHHAENTLSERGLARRDAMLLGLKREVAARGRRRRTVRAGIAAAPLLALSLALIWPALRTPTTTPLVAGPGPSVGLPDTPTPSTPSFEHVSFSEVRTQADVASHAISDDELLELLRQAGHPEAGIARRGEECIVVGLPTTSLPGPGSDASPYDAGDAPPPPSHSIGQ